MCNVKGVAFREEELLVNCSFFSVFQLIIWVFMTPNCFLAQCQHSHVPCFQKQTNKQKI